MPYSQSQSFARDLKYLNKSNNVYFVQPVDMFPQTSHERLINTLKFKGNIKNA